MQGNSGFTDSGVLMDQRNGVKPRAPWSTVDAIVSSLLAVGVGLTNCYVATILLLGWGMSSDSCSPGGPCPTQDAADRAMLVAVVGLLLSLVVGFGGLIFSACRKTVMVWAPVAGLLITGLTWIIVTSIA